MTGVVRKTLLIASILLVAAANGIPEERIPLQDAPGSPQTAPAQGKGRQQTSTSVFYTDVPVHDFDILLGRPTRTSATVSLLAYGPMEAFLSYGTNAEKLDRKTDLFQLQAGQPKAVLLADLLPNTRYFYRMSWRRSGAQEMAECDTHSFHTQRPPGAAFTFTVQADSHLDCPDAPALYVQTLRSALGNAPDFHIDLGDTFMTDKRRQDHTAAFPQYIAQRYYFGLLCHSAPLFLVLGNHDGESDQRFRIVEDSVAGWSNTMRKRYFPNPIPNAFYTGNDEPAGTSGLLEDYYAWEWGDALFVVLDPYWFTTSRMRDADASWGRTLGRRQYLWLTKTVEQSKASIKLVFIHNLVGGADASMRGGAEAAKYFEWGGHALNGQYEFEAKRPGWDSPIHEVLKDCGVNVVFHGHDHLFAKQELDGIIYQAVPQPATPGGRSVNRIAQEYGYRSGVILPSPGYLKIDVSASSARISYIGTTISENAPASTVIHEYRVYPRDSSKTIDPQGVVQ